MARVLYYRLLPLFVVIAGIISLLPLVKALPPSPAPSMMAEVSRVFDGESIRVLLHTGEVETVRYIGIDAPGPTPSDCFGPEATLYNRDLTINRTVWIELDEAERNSQGDLLAYVYLDPQGLTMVNAILVAQGLARVQEVSASTPNLRYTAIFSQLQDEAKAGDRGLWSACPATPLPANSPPNASFTFSPANPQPGDTVTFDGSGSTDLDGTISDYSWSFGDGGSASGETATHVFSAAGLYSVTLAVTDNRGTVDTTSRNVVIGNGGSSSGEPPDDGDNGGDTSTPPVTGSKPVIIESIHYDAEGEDNDNKNGEWLVIRASSQAVDLSGWTIADELGDRGVSSHVYRFPEDFELAANSRVTIFTGCGTDNSSQLYWCATTQIWDNGEDTAVLQRDTEEEVDRCHYGDLDGSERGVSEFNCVTFEYK